jgi:murein DD-endopeptidase MepM/ murein hydrolase activator NlpD
VQIIIVHPKLSQARTLTLRPAWVAGFAAALGLLVAASSGLLSYATLKLALDFQVPVLRDWMRSAGAAAPAGEAGREDAFVRHNIDALAVKLGQLQARLTRLDAIGDRVAGMAGLRPAELPAAAPGRGGPEPSASRPLSIDELAAAIERVSRGLDQRSDQLGLVESELLLRSVMARLLPSSEPLEDGLLGSHFGWRTDPFTGRSALHEGLDFNAPVGSPIVAAGAGHVVFAGWHPGYGRMVDIDHGGGIVTRYAHASRLLVKEGDIVRQGQRVAEVGSTGRSTGPHLHFEVRVGDTPRDPLQFLQAQRDGAGGGPLAAIAAAPRPRH